MLDICLTLARIDFERSADALFPTLRRKIAGKGKLRELSRLLDKLGDDAGPVLKKLLTYLDGNAKNEMFVWYVSSHGEKLRGTVNRALEKLLSVSAVNVGAVSAEKLPGGQTALLASAVEIDYPALFTSPFVDANLEKLGRESLLLKSAARFAVSVGSRMSPESLEKQGLALLSSEKVRGRLLGVLQEALEKFGLYVEFQGMELRPGCGLPLPADLSDAGDEGLIPDAFEEALLDALAAWLRDAAGRKSG